jgi:hypothetical protein
METKTGDWQLCLSVKNQCLLLVIKCNIKWDCRSGLFSFLITTRGIFLFKYHLYVQQQISLLVYYVSSPQF